MASVKITILLSTYNGENYLKEQLDSLSMQTYKNFEIIVRDDGSSDATVKMLSSYDFTCIKTTENLGAKGSFATLVQYTLANSDAEYFMFCDQDDVWESDKIEKTVSKIEELAEQNPDTPLLVHSDLMVVDENLQLLQQSFWSYGHINPEFNDFNRLLMHNTITGCTMIINRKLAEMTLPIPNEAIMHDWWIGLVASQFGKIGYIQESTIKYRQHSSNDTGAQKFGLLYIFKHLRNTNLRKNQLQAKSFLKIYKSKLERETIDMLEQFSTLDEKNFFKKRYILLKHSLLKQGIVRNIGLFVGI